MPIADAILALSPTHYWKMNSAVGDLTLPDSVGSYNLTSVINDGGGAAGPEAGTTAQRLYSDQIWTSPAFGLAGWTTHTWLLFFTVQANGAPTAFTDFLGFGDPSNRTARGFRAQFQSTASQNAAFRVIGTGNQSLSSSAPWPQTNWHYFAWTVSASGGVQVAIDGVTFSTVSTGIGTAPLSTDRLWIQSAAPMVMCHLAFVPSVLNSTVLAGVTATIPLWPTGQIPNQPGEGGGGGGGGLTPDQAAQLSAIDTKTDDIPGLVAASTYISDQVNIIRGVVEDTNTKVGQIGTDVGNIVNTLLPQLAVVINDIGAQVAQILDGITSKISSAAGDVLATIGRFFDQHSKDVLGQFNPTSGPTCERIDWNIGGASYFGVTVFITTRPTHYWPLTPDNEWTYPDLAVLRIIVSGEMVLRVPVHNNNVSVRPLPSMFPAVIAGVGVPIAPSDYHIIVDWGDGVCGYIELDYLPT